MPSTTTPVRTPVTPVRSPETTPWPEIFTSPDEICPQQREEFSSPDVAP